MNRNDVVTKPILVNPGMLSNMREVPHMDTCGSFLFLFCIIIYPVHQLKLEYVHEHLWTKQCLNI